MPHDEAKWMKLCSYNQTPSPSLPVNSKSQAKWSEKNTGEERKNELMLL